MTAGQLAAEVGVSTRTARRHVRALRDMGVPIVSDRGPSGGYRLMGPDGPAGGAVLHLEDDEAVAVAVALSMMGGPTPDGRDGSDDDAAGSSGPTQRAQRGVGPARRAAARLESALGPGARDRVTALRRQLAVTTTMVRDAPDAHVALALAMALEAGRRVRLRYTDMRGQGTDRDVDPHGLVLHAGRWYLAGWDHLRDDRRTFRLDRIVAVLATTEPIDPGHDLDAPTQVAEGVAVAPWRHQVEFVVHAPRERVAVHLRPEYAVLVADGQDTIVRIGENHLGAAAGVIARLPWACTVVKPDELRPLLCEMADRLARAAAARPGPSSGRPGPGGPPVRAE